MRPVDCRTVDDCFAACLESILELPQGSAPNFGALSQWDWTLAVAEWLDPFGLVYVELDWSTYLGAVVRPLLGYHVLTGLQRGGGRRHSVVALGTEMVHDPNSSRAGLVDDHWKWSLGLLVAKDPGDVRVRTIVHDIFAGKDMS